MIGSLNATPRDDPNINHLFSNYLSGKQFNLGMDDKIILNPQMYAPMGYSIWIASDHKIEVIPKSLAWTEEKEYF